MPRGVCKTENDVRCYPRRDMKSWLEKMSDADVLKYMRWLREYVTGAKRRITWVLAENGITSKEGRGVDVIAYTTRDGFVVRFTERSTESQNGVNEIGHVKGT